MREKFPINFYEIKYNNIMDPIIKGKGHLIHSKKRRGFCKKNEYRSSKEISLERKRISTKEKQDFLSDMPFENGVLDNIQVCYFLNEDIFRFYHIYFVKC